MGKPTLYYMNMSNASRSTLLTIKALDLDVEYKTVNLIEGEQMKPEFLAINPQHTLPTLVDSGTAICDSHAINAYLVNKYGKDDSLYPTEPLLRAIVDHRLHFNNSVLFNRYGNIVRPVYMSNAAEIPAAAVKEFSDAMEFLEIFLGDNKYVAGNRVTIADFSIIALVSSMWMYDIIPEGKFPKIDAWIKRMEQLPYYHEANQQYIEPGVKFFKAKLEANKAAK